MSEEAETKADDADEADAGEKKPGLVSRIQSRLHISLAAIVTLIIGVCLIVLASVAWLLYSLDPSRLAWGDYMTVGRSVTVALLWFAVCGLTYWTVRLWMNDVPVGDPALRDGWDAGLKLFSRHGDRLADIPCFMVFGCDSRHHQERWMGEEGHATTPPSAEAKRSIDWHLGEDRILLFCSDVGVFADHGRVTLKSHNQRTALGLAGHSQSAIGPGPPSQRVAFQAAPDDSHQADEKQRDDSEDGDTKGGPTDDSDASPNGPATETADSPTTAATMTLPSKAKPALATTTESDPIKTLDRADALVRSAQTLENLVLEETSIGLPVETNDSSLRTTKAQRTLSQLCHRLRAERFPHAAINGSLFLVESLLLQSDQNLARSTGRAIRRDLDLVRNELGVSAPITIVINDSECSDDFDELSRRLQPLHGTNSPVLGRRFSAEQVPNSEAMHTLAAESLETVEHTVHQALAMPDVLKQSDNHALIRMMIRVRRWKETLETMLVESCAARDGESAVAAPIVSGLFVASPPKPGSSSGRWIDSVLDHMVQQQNHLTWTEQEQQASARNRLLISVLAVASSVMIFGLIVQIWLGFFAS